MDLSVVVASIDARDRLAACLDALSAHAGDVEVVVVNGPSTDGTTGMIRERDDVNVLVATADRNVNAARNAGIRVATGDAIAFLSDGVLVEPGWRDAVEAALADGADIVTGPVTPSPDATPETVVLEPAQIWEDGTVSLHGGNVTFTREVLERLDGFDEYLAEDGPRDAAHRAASFGHRTAWSRDGAVRYESGAVRTDGNGDREWGEAYRLLSYRLAKNDGPRPGTVVRMVRQALADGSTAFEDVLDGTVRPSRWLSNGRNVAWNSCRGFAAGLAARYRSGSARNPNGLSSRRDRAVRTYDWR